ncbi:MAG: hypothetical protein ACOX3N_06055 [Dethiobacteria bacterium]
MKIILLASVLILILHDAGVLILAGNVLHIYPFHASLDIDEQSGPDVASGGDCPVNPAVLEGRRMAAAPDNAASGRLWGTPDIVTVLHKHLEKRIRVATNILFDRIGFENMCEMTGRLELKETAFTRKMYDDQLSLPLNVATAFELTRCWLLSKTKRLPRQS